MTIQGYIIITIISAIIALVAFVGGNWLVEYVDTTENKRAVVLIRLVTIVLAAIAIFCTCTGVNWYYTKTATGRRAVTDQRSELNNGLERTINVLNADGKVIRTYTGVIDIEGNDGGYVLFEYNGKRYTYYNCYLESIADIE